MYIYIYVCTYVYIYIAILKKMLVKSCEDSAVCKFFYIFANYCIYNIHIYNDVLIDKDLRVYLKLRDTPKTMVFRD